MKKTIAFLFLLLLLPAIVLAQQPPTCKAGYTPISTNPLVCVPGAFPGAPGPAGQTTFGDVVVIVIDVVLLIVGALAVLFLIWGGFRYITAYGNEENAESAKRIIKHSILGLIIVIMSFVLVTIITRILVLGQP